jgi:hypothetical protein
LLAVALEPAPLEDFVKKIYAFVLVLLVTGSTWAQDKQPDPRTEQALIVLAEMGQRLSELQSFSVRSDSTFDEPMSGQLVERSQTTQLSASRARGFRMDTEGDLTNSSAYFNGTDFVMYDRDKNFFGLTPFSGSVHDLTDHAAEKLGIILPVAELLRKDPGTAFLEGAETIFYVGSNTVDGLHCHHLAARNKNAMEWELWVEESTLLPRKIVVRDPSLPGAPRSVAVLRDWKLNPDLPDMIFHFLIPTDSVQIEFKVPGGKL